MRNLAAIAATVLLAVLATACGASGSDSDTATQADFVATQSQTGSVATATATLTKTTTGPSHDEFVDDLNSICTKFNAKAGTLKEDAERADSSGDYEGLADIYEQRNAIAAESMQEMRALSAPDEDAQAFAAYMAAITQQEGTMKRLVPALRDHDGTAIQTLADLLKKAASDKIAAAISLGADDCGQA